MTVRVVIATFIAAACAAAQPAQNDRPAPVSLHELSGSLERLSSRVRPAVVQVFATGLAPISEDSAESGTSTALFTTQRATGAGVILAPEGYILTNAHVVRGGRRIQVRLGPDTAQLKQHQSIISPSGKILEARVIGADKETDLAVLKVEPGAELPYLRLGDSDKVRQGQLVMAYGSPLGLESSVSMGIVSSTARQTKADDPMVYIQTDASINPGNSGGPLIDADGQVVGINTFILSQSGGSEGIGFAVPSNIASNVYSQLRKTGRVRRGEIRAYAQTVTPRMAAGLKLPQDWGVILGDVDPDGPAAKAGLEPGDIVLALDGKRMENARQFNVDLYQALVNQNVTIDFLRGGEKRAAKVTVIERQDDPMRFADKTDPTKNVVSRLGILAVGITPDLAEQAGDLRNPYGIIVVMRSADAAANGLEAGDVIYSVNGAPVKTVEALRTTIDSLKPHQPAVLQVQRDQKLRFVTIDIE